MTSKFSRKQLVKQITDQHIHNPDPTIYMLTERPENDHYLTCHKCGYKSVRIKFERFGDGTQYAINWVADTWTGFCNGNYRDLMNGKQFCNSFMIHIKLMDYDQLNKENNRIFSELCDQVLKQL